MLVKKITIILLVLVTLTACAKNSYDKNNPETDANAQNEQIVAPTDSPAEIRDNYVPKASYQSSFSRFSEQSDNLSETGVLRAALKTELGYVGSLNPLFVNNKDASKWFSEDMLDFTGGYFAQTGVCKYSVNTANNSVTLNMQASPKWHNGTSVTLDDLVFAYEVICSPDYNGDLYDEKIINVVGAIDYKEGNADTISGLILSEDKRTLTIKFLQLSPSMLAGGIFTTPLSRAYFSGISVANMNDDDKSTLYPVGFGAFRASEVGGNFVYLERNDSYWRGVPKLAGVRLAVMHPSDAAYAVVDDIIDIAEFSPTEYENIGIKPHYEMLAKESTVVNYTGFVLGKFENGENIPDTTKKCTDINLRKAIAHAIDNNYIGQQVYFGLRRAAEGIIPPAYAVVPEQTEYYEYNPEKACKILDESNFKDIDGDGFREDKNGGQLTIVWAVQESPDAETVAEFKIKQWEEIGLRVVLQDGKPIPFDSFYPSLIGETSADMFDAAWDYGKNPNPAGFWGAYAQTNFTRYSNDTIKTLCGEISSEKAWNMDFLKEKFSAFEKEFFTTLPAAPTFWRVELVAVNKKVKNFDAEGYNLHKIGVEYTE